jgi:hypothetical protein
MLKRWRDYWSPGDKLRESFEDVDRLIAQETSKVVVSAKFGSIGTPLEIDHTLKKVPTTFVLTESASAVILYATSADRTAWSEKRITLRSNTVGEVRICVL